MKEAVRKVIDTLTQEDVPGAFHKLLEGYNKCITAGGDYFEVDKSFMCVLSIKVPIRNRLETYLMILVIQHWKTICIFFSLIYLSSFTGVYFQNSCNFPFIQEF